MVSFIIAGKARQVFSLIALKAKCEANRQASTLSDDQNQTLQQPVIKCPIKKGATCTKPGTMSCYQSRCPVYFKSLERREGR